MIVDDHVLMRMGLSFALNNEPDIEVVDETGSAVEAMTICRKCSPDVVILDLRLPDGNGSELIAKLRSVSEDAKVLVYTNYGSGDEIAGALSSGANGFLLKGAPSADLLEAVRKVARGESYLPLEASSRLASSIAVNLSRRETGVLQLISKGLSNKQIADTLNVAESTVKGHMSSLLAKLGVNDRTQAVLSGYKRGLIHLD